MIEDYDLAELRGTALTGVIVGIGSLVLRFADSAQILVQCVFECGEAGVFRSGHGEDVYSSPLLFALLNRQVKDATIDADPVLTLCFDGGWYLKIVPERNGLESCVITTRHGICPIIANSEEED